MPAAGDGFDDAMLRELNRVRARYHLPAVSADGRMNGGASSHSRSMARHGYFAHGNWTTRVARAAGRPRSLGEVIGWLVQTTPQREAASMVRSWLGSPPHRHVMLDASFRRVGIGRATGDFAGQPAALYTVDFATAR